MGVELELPAGLRLARYRFVLEALDDLRLPAYQGSVLRGGFGWAFRRTVCHQSHVPSCKDCLLRGTCPYAYVFDTPPPDGSDLLSKSSDIPLPFVIEPPLDLGRHYGPGRPLPFDLILIGKGIDYLAYFLVAFQKLGEMGLGHDRVPFRLAQITTPTRQGEVVVFDGEGALLGTGGGLVQAADLHTRAEALPTDRLTVEFLTPTRLKHDGRYHSAPDFHVLVRALLRRTSSLAYFHGGQRWDTDYRGWIERAQAVRIAAAHTRWVEWERYSSRQKQRTSIGGTVGRMVYEGDLASFRPLLALGEWIHAGKACVFGNGQMRVS
jgi:hypothetical protein